MALPIHRHALRLGMELTCQEARGTQGGTGYSHTFTLSFSLFQPVRVYAEARRRLPVFELAWIPSSVSTVMVMGTGVALSA